MLRAYPTDLVQESEQRSEQYLTDKVRSMEWQEVNLAASEPVYSLPTQRICIATNRFRCKKREFIEQNKYTIWYREGVTAGSVSAQQALEKIRFLSG
jgi:hypothetical protein